MRNLILASLLLTVICCFATAGAAQAETIVTNDTYATAFHVWNVCDRCKPECGEPCKPKCEEPCKPKCDPCKPKCEPCKPMCEPCKPKCGPCCKPRTCTPPPCCEPPTKCCPKPVEEYPDACVRDTGDFGRNTVSRSDA